MGGSAVEERVRVSCGTHNPRLAALVDNNQYIQALILLIITHSAQTFGTISCMVLRRTVVKDPPVVKGPPPGVIIKGLSQEVADAFKWTF